jgi:low affinity Fe/Cu permease
MNNQSLFARFARAASNFTGASTAFILAALIIIVWAVSGPLFGFSDTWQLVINTGTTIVTFLMVFLIQNTQNRDSQAVHVKLDELIHSIEAARNDLLDAEDMDDEHLAAAHDRYAVIGKRARDTAEPTAGTGRPVAMAGPNVPGE